MTLFRILVLTIAALAAWPAARAVGHVGPAMETNNRYLKFTPMRDRVRLAYTVYLGEIPGAQARQRMDKNRDGTVDDGEANAYGHQIGNSVQQNLQIRANEAAYSLSWAEVHVGLGTPTTNAGALSVDLIGWICLDEALVEHNLFVIDRFRIPKPGETELRVVEVPGIAINRSAVGAEERGPRRTFQWLGNDVAIAHEGYQLAFTVYRDQALIPPGDHCAAATTHTPGAQGRGLGAIAAAAIVLALGGGLLWRWRQSRQPRQQQHQNKSGNNAQINPTARQK